MTASRSRRRMASTTCTIFRSALDMTSGQTSMGAAHLADIPCTPLMARNEMLQNAARIQEGLNSDVIQHEIVVFDLYDIHRGDTVVMAGSTKQYSVWEAHPWDVRDPFTLIVLSEVQAPKPADSEFIR